MNIRDEIKSAGLKFTPQRKMILEVVNKLQHCTMEEVIEAAKKEDPEITLSTVYRVMESFCDAKLLNKFVTDDAKTLYDITSGEHYHLFSQKEGVVDIKNAELSQQLRDMLASIVPPGEEIDKISIHLITKSK